MKNSRFNRLSKIVFWGLGLIVFWKIILQPFWWIILQPSIINDELHRKIVEMVRVRRDKNGQKPRDMIRAFIEVAQAGRCEEAAQYWTPGSLKRFQHSKHYRSFESFCRDFQHVTTYRLLPATYDDEGQTYSVPLLGISPQSGRIDSLWLFVILDNDRYFLDGVPTWFNAPISKSFEDVHCGLITCDRDDERREAKDRRRIPPMQPQRERRSMHANLNIHDRQCAFRILENT